jgi:hypothetical protein
VLDETVTLTNGQTSAGFELQAGAVCSAVEDTTGLTNLVSATNDGPVTLVAVDGTYTITETNDFLAPTVVPSVTPPQVSPAAVVAPAAVTAAPRTTG